ncbi:hypothetical protein [Flavobacterium sp. 102]|uniref:hypothetical protein n=1 Tax=Flavobacterium sp. 102 TaxID=2135623 RepID=UPI000F17BC42|nr:hypothetical protein [Flavobacterium sp. 102]RKS03095.1 hypothetical protein C8C84_2836 [Flavobacterium sp. 102]
MSNNHSIVCGTVGGTFLSILSNISGDDLIKTIVLAAIGAIVSFTISTVLKCILKKHEK